MVTQPPRRTQAMSGEAKQARKARKAGASARTAQSTANNAQHQIAQDAGCTAQNTPHSAPPDAHHGAQHHISQVARGSCSYKRARTADMGSAQHSTTGKGNA